MSSKEPDEKYQGKSEFEYILSAASSKEIPLQDLKISEYKKLEESSGSKSKLLEDNSEERTSLKIEHSSEEKEFQLAEEKSDSKWDCFACGQQNFATSVFTQFFILSERAFKNFIRNLFLFPAHIILCILLGLFLGGVSYNT